jgi:hypothetical protein
MDSITDASEEEEEGCPEHPKGAYQIQKKAIEELDHQKEMLNE